MALFASRPVPWVYKHRALDTEVEARKLAALNLLFKIIPHVDGKTRVCELVRFHLEDITVKGAWTGPAALDLHSHALAPVAELPVLQVLSAKHFVADLTLGLGTVVHDYLSPSQAARRRDSEMFIEANAG
jgi:acetoacetate decarboxylase